MVAEYIQYVLIALAVASGFAVVCYASIRCEQGRRRSLEKMTPEERREEEVFRRGVFKRR